MTHISHKEFVTLNWLPVTEKYSECIKSIVFKYVNDQCPNYLNEFFQIAVENIIQTRGSLTVCSFHVTYTFQSESTLYSFLNVKQLLA